VTPPAQIEGKTGRSLPTTKTSPQEPICGPTGTVRDQSHPRKSCRRTLDFHPSSLAAVTLRPAALLLAGGEGK
jgi:hypothetical protein